ncbi:haloalkane dehalogenase [Bradyrhizobium sp. USDA 4011]
MEDVLAKKTITVLGRRMAYHERGEGAPILFLHGNPTSSYLWRNVLPALRGQGRLIVPDLIGMGDSEKLPNSGPETYTFATHREFLWKFIDSVTGDREKIVLVIHDWGSALGFDWANQHRDRVRAIAYMESFVRPVARWSDWNDERRPLYQALRSEKGEEMILEQNIFIEKVFPSSVIRPMSEAEMNEYRRPFLNKEDRWPTLTWPRQIPIEGEPADVHQVMSAYSSWMSENNLPKLFINAEPGRIVFGSAREFCRSWKNQTEVTVAGIHYIQEDSSPQIGKAIATWLSEKVEKGSEK